MDKILFDPPKLLALDQPIKHVDLLIFSRVDGACVQ